MTWKPIEEVPDEEWVLLYQKIDGTDYFEVGKLVRVWTEFWEQTEPDKKERRVEESRYWKNAEHIYEPTHFMTLTPPDSGNADD